MVRSLVVPNQHAHPNPLLGLVLEQLPQRQLPRSRQRPRRLSHQLHLVIYRPTGDINQVIRLENGMADVLPALVMLKDGSFLEPNLWELAIPDMCVLVERHQAPLPDGEVGIAHPALVGIPGDPMPVLHALLHGRVLEGHAEGGIGLRRPPTGRDHREPFVDHLAGGDAGNGNGDGADELGAEDVVVLDVENEGRGAVGDGDLEALVPDGVLGVVDNAGAGDGGTGR